MVDTLLTQKVGAGFQLEARTGKRIFADGTPARSFELVSTKALPSGIIFSTYKGTGR